jgi:hypothetical protein
MQTAYLVVSYRLDVRDTAVDEQCRSRAWSRQLLVTLRVTINVAAIVTGETYRGLRDLIGCSESARRNSAGGQYARAYLRQNSDLVLLHWHPSRGD